MLNIIFNLTKISLYKLTQRNKYHTSITNFLQIDRTSNIMTPYKRAIASYCEKSYYTATKVCRFSLIFALNAGK